MVMYSSEDLEIKCKSNTMKLASSLRDQLRDVLGIFIASVFSVFIIPLLGMVISSKFLIDNCRFRISINYIFDNHGICF